MSCHDVVQDVGLLQKRAFPINKQELAFYGCWKIVGWSVDFTLVVNAMLIFCEMFFILVYLQD